MRGPDLHALQPGTSQSAAASPAKHLTPEVEECSLYRMSYTDGAHGGRMRASLQNSLLCTASNVVFTVHVCTEASAYQGA